ncbi:MAG: hypothetical protein CMK59_11260 [Proteobacteria bacterium]|nr:hypothetical protein [Pseudomonadota bacterium]
MFTERETQPLQAHAQYALRCLLRAWLEFEQELFKVPIVRRIEMGTLRKEEYLRLLRNLRAQVVEGARWITRAASSFDREYADVRSLVIEHARDEHRDYQLLEQDYVALGGTLDKILAADRNLGSEALHSFLMYRASLPNPVDMLGAMFIIEGLGEKMASGWAEKVANQMDTKPGELGTQFMFYHGQNDEHHMSRFYQLLNDVVASEEMADRVVKTARVVGRLYCMQLVELDNA